jgi:hypothetical protein
MSGFLSGVRGGSDAGFDAYDEFVPEHIPEPGSFLAGHDVLTGRDHLAVHRLARALFEARGVYDMTFGYNLARLNLDQRHPGAGFRYAHDADDPSVLRAEFTPTTEFCPQSDTLTIGSFRAFNGETDQHEFDVVEIRVDEMHQQSTTINGKLQQLADTFAETGEVRADVTGTDCGGEVPTERGADASF